MQNPTIPPRDAYLSTAGALAMNSEEKLSAAHLARTPKSSGVSGFLGLAENASSVNVWLSRVASWRSSAMRLSSARERNVFPGRQRRYHFVVGLVQRRPRGAAASGHYRARGSASFASDRVAVVQRFGQTCCESNAIEPIVERPVGFC